MSFSLNVKRDWMYIILNKEKSILKVKLTQLEIIEAKYLAKASLRKAEVIYIEIK